MDLPDDENGDVLRRLLASGDDLSAEREICFQLVFKTKGAAERLCKLVENRWSCSVSLSEIGEDFPWEANVSCLMKPDHAAITSTESELNDMAAALAGHIDGWSCEAMTV